MSDLVGVILHLDEELVFFHLGRLLNNIHNDLGRDAFELRHNGACSHPYTGKRHLSTRRCLADRHDCRIIAIEIHITGLTSDNIVLKSFTFSNIHANR